MFLEFDGYLTDVKSNESNGKTFLNAKLRVTPSDYEYLSVGVTDKRLCDANKHRFIVRVTQTFKGDKSKGEKVICLSHHNVVGIAD